MSNNQALLPSPFFKEGVHVACAFIYFLFVRAARRLLISYYIQPFLPSSTRIELRDAWLSLLYVMKFDEYDDREREQFLSEIRPCVMYVVSE